MDIIHEPTGKALEYAPLALTGAYTGCGHGCALVYCYSPICLHMSREDFHSDPQPRKNYIERLRRAVPKFEGDDREILLFFTCDPYQPVDVEHELTRQVIEVLIEHELTFTILTKGGMRAVRDFDLLEGYEKARFGTTLTVLDGWETWEPDAAPPLERIATMRLAHEKGIPTWNSLEPGITLEEALKVIDATCDICGEYKVGKLNYHEHAKTVDWVAFREGVVDALEEIGVDYYIKESLREAV